MDVAFRFGLQKKRSISWPRLEDAEHLMVAGSARPLTDALRIAFVELIDWLNVPKENMIETFGPRFEPRGKRLVDVIHLICDRYSSGDLDTTVPVGLDLDLTNRIATITCGNLEPRAEITFAGPRTTPINPNRDVARIHSSAFLWIAQNTRARSR